MINTGVEYVIISDPGILLICSFLSGEGKLFSATEGILVVIYNVSEICDVFTVATNGSQFGRSGAKRSRVHAVRRFTIQFYTFNSIISLFSFFFLFFGYAFISIPSPKLSKYSIKVEIFISFLDSSFETLD